MNDSYEIYNILSASNLQINSRFIPYYKKAGQVIPTGTMMGELGFKFGGNTLFISTNETYAVLNEETIVDLTANWEMAFGDVELVNVARNHMYEISVSTPEVSIQFIRKVYIVEGLERQWHVDYKAKLLSEGENIHG